MPSLSDIMRAIASSLREPVVFLLIALAAVVVVLVGVLIAEVFVEHRKFRVRMPKLVDDLRHEDDLVSVIVKCGLLDRQKRLLLELTKHPEIDDEERESMAVNLVFEEQTHYDNRVRVSDYIAKVAPMLGLMGTLIPLGPGLIALGQGDTQTLSESLLMAFDTTIMGLVIAAIAMFISTVHKAWYSRYLSAFETAAECVLREVRNA